MKHSQNDAILNHFLSGKTLSSIEALKLFKTMRLASRIYDLSQSHAILNKWEQRNGKRYKRYWMKASK